MQVFGATKKLSCKVCCKIPLFLIMLLLKSFHWHIGFFFHSYASFLFMHDYWNVSLFNFMFHWWFFMLPLYFFHVIFCKCWWFCFVFAKDLIYWKFYSLQVLLAKSLIFCNFLLFHFLLYFGFLLLNFIFFVIFSLL